MFALYVILSTFVAFACAGAVTPAYVGSEYEAIDSTFDCTSTQSVCSTTAGAFGVDFDVGPYGLVITELGAYDTDSTPDNVVVKIYDRTNGAVRASVTLDTYDVQFNRFGYKHLSSVLSLTPGFKGSVVAEYAGSNYVELPAAAASVTLLAGDSHELVSIVGSGRSGSAGSFPTTVTAGPAARYLAGTFTYSDGIYDALTLPAGVQGNQNFDKTVGLDFVVHHPICVRDLGAFDSQDTNGLQSDITVSLYDTITESVLAMATLSGTNQPLRRGFRYATLEQDPVCLPEGFHGTIVAEGYSATENLGNLGIAGFTNVLAGTTADGAIEFVGSRFGLATGAFPNVVEPRGPAIRFAGPSFSFYENL